jgi:hypothetical protein
MGGETGIGGKASAQYSPTRRSGEYPVYHGDNAHLASAPLIPVSEPIGTRDPEWSLERELENLKS